MKRGVKKVPNRLLTFVPGLDDLAYGGLPRGHTTLMVGVKIEIVDLHREHLRGPTEGVILSPTLVCLARPPVRHIAANPSNHGDVLLALGVVP